MLPLLRKYGLVVLVALSSPAVAQDVTRGAGSAATRLPVRLVDQGRDSAATLFAPAEAPLPLAPPGRRSPAGGSARTPPGPRSALTTAVTSLAVVLGLFTVLVWWAKRRNPRGSSLLPGEVLETLGRVPLHARQEMHLVRVGHKLLLLAVTPTSAETLTEIADPVEIDRLTGICRQNQPGSISASFREVLAQLNRQAP
jgi:flagellar biogenesis protein FliO